MKYKGYLLEIIDEFDRVCRHNNLRYFLTGGSLLGAIRHDGMIPWDDDIDVAMPRNDYEKLRQIAGRVFSKKFSYVTNSIDSDYYYCYAKIFHNQTTLVELKDPFYIGGVFVDVFPIDGMPKNRLVRAFHYKHFYFWRKMSYILACKNINSTNSNVIKASLGTLRNKLYKNFFTLSNVLKKCDSVAMKYSFDDCEIVANLCGAWGKKEITLKVFFEEYLEHTFEGRILKIPKGYSGFLTCLYGNYLQLPPEEKRVSHHYHYYLNLEKRVTKEEIPEL